MRLPAESGDAGSFHPRGNSYELRASSIGSAKLIHIRANRTISARSSGSFRHSASDKHSHAFARYALSAAIGTFSSQSSRDPLLLARAIDARAPPADPAAGRKQHRRMSSVNLPQASAGAALFGRAV